MESKKDRNTIITLTLVGIFPFLINGYINSKIYKVPFLYWGFELISWLLIPAIALFLILKNSNVTLSSIGMNSKIFGKRKYFLLIVLCIAIGPIDYYLYKNTYSFLYSIFPNKAYFSYKSIVPDSGIMRLLISIYFALTAGFVEEIFYRGLIFKIADYFSRPIVFYLTISPLIFSIVHWEGGFVNVAASYFLGLFAAGVYISTKNLWPLIIGHIYTDFIWFS